MPVIITLDDDLAQRLERQAHARQTTLQQWAIEILNRAPEFPDQPQAWRELNARRFALIHKRHHGGLTKDEAAELAELQPTDEFSFRCLYCLWRERWEADGHHGFGVEHVEPQATSPEQRIVYDNVIYACNTCNSTRRDVPLPIDTVNDSLGLHLQVLADGTVQTLSETGEELVELCRLNRPLLVAARQRILNLIAVLQTSDHPDAVQALRDLLAYPSDLPDLSALRPPGGNATGWCG